MAARRTEGAPNGAYVTWRELNLLMQPVHAKLDDLGVGMKLLLEERSEAKGVVNIRKRYVTGGALLLGAGWWLPDVVQRIFS